MTSARPQPTSLAELNRVFWESVNRYLQPAPFPPNLSVA